MNKRASTDRQWANADHPTTLRSTPPVLVPGATVGTFSVELVLGAGSMADVVGVEDRAANRRLALKIARAGDAESKSRLAHEAEILNLVGPPGAVAFHGAGTLPDGRSYLAMDWLAGETLGSRLERGPLAPDEAARLAEGLARSLRQVQAAGVIHGDLKPDNIFLVGRALASVTLLDFGIARRFGAGPCDRVDGTPLYLAPEQAAGAELTPAADLYSVGAVLFTAVAGRPPFLFGSAEQLLRAHLETAPPLLRSISPSAPPEMEALVAGLLAKRVSSRATLDDIERAVGVRSSDASGRTRRDSPGVVFLKAPSVSNPVVVMDDRVAAGSAPPRAATSSVPRPTGRWASPAAVPTVAARPSAPSSPSLPAMQSMPSMPAMPSMPSMPAMPSMSSMPSMRASLSMPAAYVPPAAPPQAPGSPFGLTLDLDAAVMPVDLRPRRLSGFFLVVLLMAAVAVGVGWWMSRTTPPSNVIRPIDAELTKGEARTAPPAEGPKAP